MNDRVYFNSVANKWDSMHSFDEEKIKAILDISNIKEGAKILDVATGTGILIKYLLDNKPKKIIAVDMAEKMIVYGNRYRSSYEEIDIALTKAEELFRRGKYKESLELSTKSISFIDKSIIDSD